MSKPDRTIVYMQYLGALTLLGRLVPINLNADDQHSVDRCFEDANAILKEYKSHIFFARTGNGGWGAFQHQDKQEKENQS